MTIDRMQVEELSIAYGSKLAVNSVSLPIRQGEVLALIGPSGAARPPCCARSTGSPS
jgi:phosphate transport system ATP-binding protein